MNCFAGGSHVSRKPEDRPEDDVVETDAEDAADFFLLLATDEVCFLGLDLAFDDMACQKAMEL